MRRRLRSCSPAACHRTAMQDDGRCLIWELSHGRVEAGVMLRLETAAWRARNARATREWLAEDEWRGSASAQSERPRERFPTPVSSEAVWQLPTETPRGPESRTPSYNSARAPFRAHAT